VDVKETNKLRRKKEISTFEKRVFPQDSKKTEEKVRWGGKEGKVI